MLVEWIIVEKLSWNHWAKDEVIIGSSYGYLKAIQFKLIQFNFTQQTFTKGLVFVYNREKKAFLNLH